MIAFQWFEMEPNSIPWSVYAKDISNGTRIQYTTAVFLLFKSRRKNKINIGSVIVFRWFGKKPNSNLLRVFAWSYPKALVSNIRLLFFSIQKQKKKLNKYWQHDCISILFPWAYTITNDSLSNIGSRI